MAHLGQVYYIAFLLHSRKPELNQFKLAAITMCVNNVCGCVYGVCVRVCVLRNMFKDLFVVHFTLYLEICQIAQKCLIVLSVLSPIATVS